MKAADLNGTHLGRTITVTTPEGEVTGMLAGVEHAADLIDDSNIMDVTPRYALGQPRVVITIAGWGGRTFSPRAEVTVQ